MCVFVRLTDETTLQRYFIKIIIAYIWLGLNFIFKYARGNIDHFIVDLKKDFPR